MEEEMKDIYEEWRSYESKFILLRPVVVEDAKELLQVYSDKKARELFNCDNFPNPCYFDTLEQMKNEIQFYLSAYKYKCFVRWTIVWKPEEKIIGTIENFHRIVEESDSNTKDPFHDVALLRIDLLSEYEKRNVIREIVNLVQQTTKQDFHCDIIVTKAVSQAVERRKALEEIGFDKSEDELIGEQGERYGDYFTKRI